MHLPHVSANGDAPARLSLWTRCRPLDHVLYTSPRTRVLQRLLPVQTDASTSMRGEARHLLPRNRDAGTMTERELLSMTNPFAQASVAAIMLPVDQGRVPAVRADDERLRVAALVPVADGVPVSALECAVQVRLSTTRVARALARRIWCPWTREEADRQGILAAHGLSEKELRNMETPPVGYCSVCSFYDDDTVIGGMHWILTHSCQRDDERLRRLPHSVGVKRAEAVIVDRWRQHLVCVDAFGHSQWENAIRQQQQYDSSQARALEIDVQVSTNPA